jgi:hypothetical protein
MATHPLDRASTRHRREGRLLAWLRGPAGDAALASGANPATSTGVAARVAQLTQRRRVLALAEGIERRVERAARALPLCRRLVIDDTGPLCNPDASGTLQGAVREALDACEAGRNPNPPPV